MSWEDEQHFESDWWGDCRNTFGEDLKHVDYARRMGLQFTNDGGRSVIEMHGRSILDIGGGPTSMALKARNPGRITVVDPCEYPAWTRARYAECGVDLIDGPAEEFLPDCASGAYDEAWCYNVLQHTIDPQAIIHGMRSAAQLIRIFEWVDFPPSPGHPHELKVDRLLEWLSPQGMYWFDSEDVFWTHDVEGRQRWAGRALFGYMETGASE